MKSYQWLVLVLASLGASAWLGELIWPHVQAAPPASAPQRWVISYDPHGGKGTFLLDTQTGECFQCYENREANTWIWIHMKRGRF